MSKKYPGPLSTFWACFFSSSIFGVIWAYRMKKTIHWILLMLLAVLTGVSFVLNVYFMYKWTVQYNRDNYDYSLKNKNQTIMLITIAHVAMLTVFVVFTFVVVQVQDWNVIIGNGIVVK